MTPTKQLKHPILLILTVAVALLAGACSPEPAPPPPTRTPAPTFTPTVETPPTPVDVNAAATAQAAIAQAAATQAAALQPVDPAQNPAPGTDQGAQPVPAEPAEEPTATPTPLAAEVVISQQINVRGGPGTTYNILGGAQPGQRFPVTGKNQAGDWWQINFNGQSGWVFGQLVTTQNVEQVAIVQNIPAPPPPPPATNTPVPQPTQAPAEPPPAQPTPTPQSSYRFNVAVTSNCLPQESGNWFEGRTYVNGVPQSGYKVVFSYAPDGPPVTAPMQSGPHEGYPGWDQGYYSHIIRAAGQGAEAGSWFAWIVDDAGQRISEIASWQFDGKSPNTCNQIVVDFDSR